MFHMTQHSLYPLPFVIFAVLEWLWPTTTEIKWLCRFWLLINSIKLKFNKLPTIAKLPVEAGELEAVNGGDDVCSGGAGGA